VAEIILKANIRDYKGRSDANTARRAGKVPGVFYLKNEKNIPIEVDALDLRPLVYTSESRVVDLQLNDGTSELCILREVQFDPVTDNIMHFDLMGLIRGQKITFEVPVLLEGSAVGVKAGGVLTQILHRVEVECLPKDLPEHISVDITHIEAGQTVTVAELKSEGIEILNDPDQPVAVIGHARAEEVDESVEEEGIAQDAEPEVIAKGKEEEEA